MLILEVIQISLGHPGGYLGIGVHGGRGVLRPIVVIHWLAGHEHWGIGAGSEVALHTSVGDVGVTNLYSWLVGHVCSKALVGAYFTELKEFEYTIMDHIK